MTTTQETATTEQIIRAIVLTGRKVVECPSPGDATSPVYLHDKRGRTTLGQAADFAHRIEDVAAKHNAVEIGSYWDRDRDEWRTSITGIERLEYADKLDQVIRDDERREIAERYLGGALSLRDVHT